MSPTIQSQLAVLHSGDGIVDLFELDCSSFGGDVYHFSDTCYESGDFYSWGGQTFQLMPIGIDNLELKASNSDLPQPTLSISNVGGPLLSQVVALGDLTGAKITHWKTKVSFLDGGANPDTTQYVGPQVWYIYQKTLHTNQQIQWTLACVLDRPGYNFPIRQIIRYPGINQPDGIYFPGVSPYRTSQYQSQ